MRRASVLMLSGHVLVRGALPSSTSSSSKGSTPGLVVDSPDFPVTSGPVGTLVPGSIPRRLDRGSESSLKFLTLGLMGGTQASSGPFLARGASVMIATPGTRPLSNPAGENSR